MQYLTDSDAMVEPVECRVELNIIPAADLILGIKIQLSTNKSNRFQVLCEPPIIIHTVSKTQAKLSNNGPVPHKLN